jgi:hypothetical protein
MSDEYVANADLKPALVPAPGADFGERIYPFAMSFNGYQTWGGDAILRDVFQRVWNEHQRTGDLPESVTLLRSSLFGAGRAMRFTDGKQRISYKDKPEQTIELHEGSKFVFRSWISSPGWRR